MTANVARAPAPRSSSPCPILPGTTICRARGEERGGTGRTRVSLPHGVGWRPRRPQARTHTRPALPSVFKNPVDDPLISSSPPAAFSVTPRRARRAPRKWSRAFFSRAARLDGARAASESVPPPWRPQTPHALTDAFPSTFPILPLPNFDSETLAHKTTTRWLPSRLPPRAASRSIAARARWSPSPPPRLHRPPRLRPPRSSLGPSRPPRPSR